MYEWINLNVSAIVSLFVLGFAALYFYVSRNHNYFKSLGIDGPKPIIFFGSLYKLSYLSLTEISSEDYKKYGRIYGWFFGTQPTLVISEPYLIKDIFIKDFHKFVDRQHIVTGEPFSDRQLTNALGDDWKQLRSVLSPTFSSGKMRRMHTLVEDCVNSLETVIMNATKNKQEIELKKLMGNLTMDVIATCAFATKTDTHNEPNNLFIKYGTKALRGNWKIFLSIAMITTFPEFAKKLKLSFFHGDVKDFFSSAVVSIMKKRENSKENRVDLLQLMINAKNQENSVKNEEINNKINESSESLQINKSKYKTKFSETDIISSAFIFLVAGYETTSSLLTFLTYSLALHEECQQKLYKEIKSVEKLDYDTIASLPYLDACINETQRLYTLSPLTTRVASEDYKLGDTGITIPKGMAIHINIEGIHHDPQYYPNPDRFDPERFMPENRDKLIANAFIPFGMGPRNCIGMRFALMEAKTAIAHLITKFKFVRTANTCVPLKYACATFIMTPAGDVKLGVEVRNVS